MALSFLDQPAESNIINTYVQSPYQEILQAPLAKQGRYDETLGALQANQEYLDQLQALEGSGQADYLTQAKTGISDISSSFANKDLSDPFIRRQLRDEIRRRIDPTKINNIVQSQKNLAERNKIIADYDARGLYYEPYERTQDPYYTKQLSADQVYNYTPRAFQDPDEMIIKRFKSLPVKESSGIVGNRVMRYESNKDAINQTMNETVRNIKDSVQGQWIITQAKLNGTYTGDDNSTVQAYVESLRPEYTIDNKVQQGFVPEYMLEQNIETYKPTFPIERLTEAETLSKEQYKASPFINDYRDLNNTLRQATDNFKSVQNDPMASTETITKAQTDYLNALSNFNYKQEQVEYIAKSKGIDLNKQQQEALNKAKNTYLGNKNGTEYKKEEQLLSTLISFAEDNGIKEEITNWSSNKQIDDFVNNIIEENYNASNPESNKPFMVQTGPGISIPISRDKSKTKEENKFLTEKSRLATALNTYLKENSKHLDVVKDALKEGKIDIPRTKQSSVLLAPITKIESGVGMDYNAYTKKFDTPSPMWQAVQSIQRNLTPETKQVEAINGKDKDMKKFKNYDSFDISDVSSIPTDKGWYIMAQAKEKSKGTTELKYTGDEYRVYFHTTSERLAAGLSYLNNGNFLMGYMMANPEIGESLKDDVKETMVPVTNHISREQEYAYIKAQPNGTYNVVLPDGRSLEGITKESAAKSLYGYSFETLNALVGGNTEKLNNIIRSNY